MNTEDELKKHELEPSECTLLKVFSDYELTPFGELSVQDGERKLSLYNTWTPSLNEFMHQQELSWLAVSYVGSQGYWNGKDLEFLRQMPFLTGLSLVYRERLVLEPIHSLHKLRRLRLAVSCGCPMDFSAFPELEILEFPWLPKRDSFNRAAKLRRLVLEGYKRKNADGLETLTQLEHLDLYSSPIEDIRAIGNLGTLTDLRLAHNRCLTDLSPLAALKGLKRVRLQNLPKVRDLDVLAACCELEDLEVLDWKGELDISFVRQLPKLKVLVLDARLESLQPLTHHPSLERVLFSTATDNDSAPLLTLKRLRKVHFHSKWRANHSKEIFSNRGVWIREHIRE